MELNEHFSLDEEQLCLLADARGGRELTDEEKLVLARGLVGTTALCITIMGTASPVFPETQEELDENWPKRRKITIFHNYIHETITTESNIRALVGTRLADWKVEGMEVTPGARVVNITIIGSDIFNVNADTMVTRGFNMRVGKLRYEEHPDGSITVGAGVTELRFIPPAKPCKTFARGQQLRGAPQGAPLTRPPHKQIPDS